MNDDEIVALTGAMLEVEAERLAQHARWGQQRHAQTVWGAVLAEEAGEAAQATLRLRSTPLDDPVARRCTILLLATEVCQVAAVAVAWLEHLHEALDAATLLPDETWDRPVLDNASQSPATQPGGGG